MHPTPKGYIDLPDAIDLLGLCVNAGLDFMLSLKWVVEKSPPSVMIDELNTVLQEINVGKFPPVSRAKRMAVIICWRAGEGMRLYK